MKMKNWISTVAVLALACSAVADWRGQMPEDLVALRPYERTASVYHSYEFEPIADTPPPDGFKPFYISHYVHQPLRSARVALSHRQRGAGCNVRA